MAGLDVAEWHIEYWGVDALGGPTVPHAPGGGPLVEPPECVLRVAWRCDDPRTAGLVGRELVPLTLSAPPAGLTGAGGGGGSRGGTELLGIWPTLVDKKARRRRGARDTMRGGALMSRLPLRELCGYRAGDKGDIANVAIFADDDETYALIVREVTAERVKAHFGAMVRGRVDRYEAANVRALNFVMHGALGGGGPSTLRADNLGKTLGGALGAHGDRRARLRWPAGGAPVPSSRGPTRS